MYRSYSFFLNSKTLCVTKLYINMNSNLIKKNQTNISTKRSELIKIVLRKKTSKLHKKNLFVKKNILP